MSLEGLVKQWGSMEVGNNLDKKGRRENGGRRKVKAHLHSNATPNNKSSSQKYYITIINLFFSQLDFIHSFKTISLILSRFYLFNIKRTTRNKKYRMISRMIGISMKVTDVKYSYWNLIGN